MIDEIVQQLTEKMLSSVKDDPEMTIDLDGTKLKGKAFVCAVLVNNGEGTQVVVKGRTLVTRFMAFQLEKAVEAQAEQAKPQPFAHAPMVN